MPGALVTPAQHGATSPDYPCGGPRPFRARRAATPPAARAGTVAALLICLALNASAVGAQGVPDASPHRAAPGASALPVLTPPAPPADGGVGLHVLASAVVPGTSQLLAGDGRWVPYMAAEVWGWVSYFQQRRTGDRLSRRYREVARQVARRISVGEKRDTTWEYYEAMAHWPASGAWDRDPGTPGVQPETQPGTYNGQVWALAKGLYTPGGDVDVTTPGYGQALSYYLRRAISPEFAWAWGVSQLEQQEYVMLIERSDGAYRAARDYLGLILVNHVASTVDAFVTARLRQLGAEGASLETVPDHDSSGWRVRHEVRIRF